MKIKSYHLLFRLFSFLTDKTNGFSLFAKYKVILGTLILGLTASSSCAKKTYVVTCYDPAPQDPIANITCYDTTIVENVEDTTATEVKFVPPIISDDEIILIEPNGSLEDFMKWVQSEIQYPEELRGNEIAGRITVRLTIDEIGNVTNPIILKGFDAVNGVSPAETEVIRVLSLSPQWIPGQHNGKAVSVSIVIPVRFSPDMNNKKMEE